MCVYVCACARGQVFTCGRILLTGLQQLALDATAAARTGNNITHAADSQSNVPPSVSLQDYSSRLETLRAQVESSAKEQTAIDAHIKELHYALNLLARPPTLLTWEPVPATEPYMRVLFMPVHIKPAVAGALSCRSWSRQTTGTLDRHAPLVTVSIDDIPRTVRACALYFCAVRDPFRTRGNILVTSGLMLQVRVCTCVCVCTEPRVVAVVVSIHS